MTQALYLCPACGTTLAADRPLWRCDCGSHLNLAPGEGLVRGEIETGDASLWRYRTALAMAGGPRGSLGGGWALPHGTAHARGATRVARRRRDAAGRARLGRRDDPLQARNPDADRLIQGP